MTWTLPLYALAALATSAFLRRAAHRHGTHPLERWTIPVLAAVWPRPEGTRWTAIVAVLIYERHRRPTGRRRSRRDPEES